MINQPNIERFNALTRMNKVEDILSPQENQDIKTINMAFLNVLYNICKIDPETACQKFAISKSFASAIANSDLSNLFTLANSTFMIFKPACDEKKFIDALSRQSDDMMGGLHLLASTFSTIHRMQARN